MLERRELILKVCCGLIAALVLYRLGLAVLHINPLYHLTIPALPSLASSTNSAAPKSTNSNIVLKGAKPPTNAPGQVFSGKSTNLVSATNSVALSTNLDAAAQAGLAHATNNNAQIAKDLALSTNAPPAITNTFAQNSNTLSARLKPGTNSSTPPRMVGAQLPPGMPPGAMPGMPPGAMPGMMPGMMVGGMPGMMTPGPPLPPEIQARIDKIIDSEILAPVMHPMPTALLGIAGKDVFLRTPNGQTGMIKEGEELGGVKVLRVAVNRVLVEEQGQRKELTIFSGLGSESLLSTQNDSPK